MKKNRKNSIFSRKGFTIAELIVAIGLFSAVASIAIGGFVQALRTQRQSAALIAANNNVFLAMEQMAREIRIGRLICTEIAGTRDYCSDEDFNGLRDRIAFISGTTNEMIAYRLFDGAIERGVRNEDGLSFSPITGGNTLVFDLKFFLSGNLRDDGLQPRVTISVAASVKKGEIGVSGKVTRLQTTVSSRQPDT